MSFRRSDRRALLFLFAVILAFWGGMLLERRLSQRSGASLTLDEVAMDSLQSGETLFLGEGRGGFPVTAPVPTDTDEHEAFSFDPNTADSATLRRLGLSGWQIKNIYKYRARGGRYHTPEDFKRIYGMTPEVYERLASYIHIDRRFRYYDEADFAADDARREAHRRHYDSLRTARYSDSSSISYPRQEKFTELVQLDLNAVDTTTLKKVPGIASVRARQILRYRDRLGGFVSVDQLAEIKDLPPELQAWFCIKTPVTRKLNLNKASFGELSRHPYIGSVRAHAIYDYRRIHGTIRSLRDFSLLPEFSEEDIRRLEPYVDY